MATRSIRNIINNSISRVIPEIKTKIKEEIEKKVEKLQQEIISPETIINTLKAEINKEICSIKGKEKFSKKVDDIEDILNSIEELILKGISRLQELENKIIPLTTANLSSSLPPGVPSPMEKIKGITDFLQPLTNTLNMVVKAAPGILAGSSGPAASGTIISNTTNQVNKAKSLIAEFKNLFRSLPRLLKQYQRMADKILSEISSAKIKLQEIINQIGLAKNFLIYIELKFLEDCNNLQEPSPEDLTTGDSIPPDMALEDIITQTQQLYGSVLNNLIAQGDKKAIERVYQLNENFEQTEKIRVSTIFI